MDYWDAFKLFLKFFPCIKVLLSDLKEARKNDDKVGLDELTPIVTKFITCIKSKVNAAIVLESI